MTTKNSLPGGGLSEKEVKEIEERAAQVVPLIDYANPENPKTEAWFDYDRTWRAIKFEVLTKRQSYITGATEERQRANEFTEWCSTEGWTFHRPKGVWWHGSFSIVFTTSQLREKFLSTYKA